MSSAAAAQSALALQRPIQTLSVACCVAMAIAMLPAAYQGELFAWHPLMFTLGFIGFMTEVSAGTGVLVRSRGGTWCRAITAQAGQQPDQGVPGFLTGRAHFKL